MGALTKKRNRSIDSLWRGNDSLIAAVEAAVGLPIGSDDGVLFIQDTGTKVVGRAYIDKNNGKMYRCIVETTSVSNDSNFEMIGIEKNSVSVEELGTFEEIDLRPYGIALANYNTFHFFKCYKNKNIVIMTIDFITSVINSIPSENYILGNLPIELRPKSFICIPTNSYSIIETLKIDKSGTVSFIGKPKPVTGSTFSAVTYVV